MAENIFSVKKGGSFDVSSVLKELGDDLVFRIVKILMLKKKRATGELIKSIDYVIGDKNGKYFLDLLMADYGIYVDQGRGKGTFPPVDALRKWMDIRGIPESALYPIGRSIAKNGIPGIYFIEEAVSKLELEFEALLDDYYENEYGDEVERQLKNALKTR